MKKLFFFLSVAVLGVAAASCQKELAVAEGGKGNVSITIQTPEVATKAIADGMNVDIVYYEIYKNEAGHKNSIEGTATTTGTPLIKGTVPMNAKGASLTLNLLQGQEYVGLFWAQVDGQSYYDVRNLRDIKVAYPNEAESKTYANDEARAAFCKSQVFGTGANVKVVLERPFAQINLGTTMSSIDKTVNGYEINLKESSMTVKGVANSFNVAAMTAGETEVNVEFSYATLPYAFNPSETLVANNQTWAYAGMNYVLVPGDAATVDVTYSIKTDVGTVTRNVPVVPVEKNHRTNLIGNLLTQETTIDIVVDEKFADNDLDGGKFGVINGQYYVKAETSAEFYAAVADEDVDIVILTDDVVLDTPVTRADVVNALTVSAGKSLTIDLDGHTLSWTSANQGDAMIVNRGELNLVGEGSVVYTFIGEPDSSYGKGNYTIYNYGELTIDGPTVENATAKMSHASYAVNCYSGGNLYLKSGNILNENYQAVRIFAADDSKPNNVVIDGGKILGTRAIQIQLPTSNAASAPEVTLTMNDGELESNEQTYNLAIYVTTQGQSGENVTLNLNGGVYNGNVALTAAATPGAEVNVNGGTFNSAYGVYSYATNAVAQPVINIKGGEFASLYSTLYLDSADEVYTLANDIALDADETITIPAGMTWNLDLNGKTITAESDEASANRNLFDAKGGTLTIKNGTIEYAHVGTNMGWNASTNLFNITAGGVLNLEDVTAKNLGGSDMAFVAHLNNWGEATLNVENCTLESTYIAVRVFNSGYDMNNVTIKNTTLKGKYCFWVHNYKAAGDSAGDDSTLNFDILNGTNTFVPAEGKAPILYGFNNPIYYDTCGNIYVAEGVGQDAEGSYMIANAAGMLWFANEVNVNKNSFSGKTVKLAANIDLAGIDWEPISQTGTTQFKGTFDGNEKTISNLTINTTDKGGSYASGLFGWIMAATVKNLNIDGADIKAQHYVGTIAGYLEWSGCTVENCHVSNAAIVAQHNSASCGNKVGGIVGYAGNADTLVKDCTVANSTIVADRDAGQVVGAAKEVNVENCSANNVTVSAAEGCTDEDAGKNVRNEIIGRVL